MTTVCFKGNTLAGDTRVMFDNVIEPGDFRKVFRLKDGSLIGFAGDVPEFQRIVAVLKKNPNKAISAKSGLQAIWVKPDGTVWQRDAGGWTRSDTAEYYAIGSGRVPALVAMECGKTARQAIEIAMKFDGNTGGKVQTVKLR